MRHSSTRRTLPIRLWSSYRDLERILRVSDRSVRVLFGRSSWLKKWARDHHVFFFRRHRRGKVALRCALVATGWCSRFVTPIVLVDKAQSSRWTASGTLAQCEYLFNFQKNSSCEVEDLSKLIFASCVWYYYTSIVRAAGFIGYQVCHRPSWITSSDQIRFEFKFLHRRSKASQYARWCY